MSLSSASSACLVLLGLSFIGAPSPASLLQNQPIAKPTISTTPAQNGAAIVTLLDTTAGSKIYYTLDGTQPRASSTEYLAPFLVASDSTLKAVALAAHQNESAIAEQIFNLKLAPGTLVWSDEFTNSTSTNAQPDAALWGYDTGASGFGNHELEHYCAWGSRAAPCAPATPNAYVGNDGNLHIVARQTAPSTYTSARLKTEGRFSFRYGRLEFRAKLPESQGLWPAGWTLGNNVTTKGWPACGEQDILERVDAAKTPDWNQGSVHGPGFTGTPIGAPYHFPAARQQPAGTPMA